ETARAVRMVLRLPAERPASRGREFDRTSKTVRSTGFRRAHTAHTSPAYCPAEFSRPYRCGESAREDLRQFFAARRSASARSYPDSAAEPEREYWRNIFRSSRELHLI